MDERTRLAVTVAVTAVMLGALADSLLRETPWGLNAAIWIAALLLAIALLAGRRVSPLAGEGRWMAIPALLFGVSFAWRDSTTLKAMDAAGVLLCLGLMAYRGHAGRLRFGEAWEYAVGVARAAWESVSGSILLVVNDIGWDRLPRGRWSAALGAAGRGLLLAVPLLFLFGWLLSSADAVFEGYVANLARIDPTNLAVHLLVTLACAWGVAGYLRGLLLYQDPPSSDAENIVEPAKPVRMGAVEIGTALAMLNVLFLAFVVIQVRYLFGGSELVQQRAGLTYAQYARRGFFELVWAAALALPLLLGAHALLDTSVRGIRRMFNVLAGSLIALLLVVLFSAAQRMRLYQAEYGMTELRFYTSAFMVWLAVLFAWFGATVLRGMRKRFAFGAVVSAMVGVLVLHVSNPDSLIARTNVARALEGKTFDAAHAAELSGDAVPVLIASLPALPQAARSRLEEELGKRWSGVSRDWRTWSMGRDQALEAIPHTRLRTPVPLLSQVEEP